MIERKERTCLKCKGAGKIKKGFFSKEFISCPVCFGVGEVIREPKLWEAMDEAEGNLFTMESELKERYKKKAEELKSKGIHVKSMDEVCGPEEKIDGPLWVHLKIKAERYKKYQDYLDVLENQEN